MPRKQTARPSPPTAPRRPNGVSTVSTATRTVAAYTRDTRWATPSSRRRTDVFVVDLADRYAAPANAVDDDSLLLTA